MLSLKLYFSCVSYNFNMSYFDLDADSDSNEYMTIFYPEKWAEFFKDYEFTNNMFSFCCITF